MLESSCDRPLAGEGFICCFGWQVLSKHDIPSGGMMLQVVNALLHYWWSSVCTPIRLVKALSHELCYILLAGKRSLASDFYTDAFDRHIFDVDQMICCFIFIKESTI